MFTSNKKEQAKVSPENESEKIDQVVVEKELQIVTQDEVSLNENLQSSQEKDSTSSSFERETNKIKRKGEVIVEPVESLQVGVNPTLINRSSTDVATVQTDLKSPSEDTDFLPKVEPLSIPVKEDSRKINDISVSPQPQQSSRKSVEMIEKTGNPESIAGKTSDPNGTKRPPTGLYAKLKAKTMSSSLITSAQKKESNKSPVNNTPVGVSTESNVSSEVLPKMNEKTDIDSNINFKKASIESKTISSSKSNTTPQVIKTSPLSERQQSGISLPVTEKRVDNPTAINSKVSNQVNTENSKPSSSKMIKNNFSPSTFSDTIKSMKDGTAEADNKTWYHQGLVEQQNLNKNNDTKFHEHKNEKIVDIAKLKAEFSKDKQTEAVQKELNNSVYVLSEKKSPVYDPNKVIVFPDKKTKTDHKEVVNFQNRRNTVPSNFSRKHFENKVENPLIDPKEKNGFQSGNINDLKLLNRNSDSNPSNIDTLPNEHTKSEEQSEQNTKNMTQLANEKMNTGFNPNEVIQFPDQKKPSEEIDNHAMNYKDILAANRSSLQTRARNSSFLVKHEKNEEHQKLKQNTTKQQPSLVPQSGNNNKNRDISSKSSAISPREKLIKNIEDHGIPTLPPGNVPDTTKTIDHATVSNPTKPHTKKQMTKTDYVFTITNVRRDEPVVLDKKPPNIRPKPVKQNSQDNEVDLVGRSMSVGHFIQSGNAKKAPPQVMKKLAQKTHSEVGYETNIKPSDLFSKTTTLPRQNRVVNPQKFDLR